MILDQGKWRRRWSYGDPLATLRPDPVLPSAVLSLDGGGPYATVPDADTPLRSARRLFQMDVGLLDAAHPPGDIRWGMRAHVRLTFAPKPLAVRAGRAIRAVFLEAFAV